MSISEQTVQAQSLVSRLRRQIITWICIIGGALTLAGHWGDFITLADSVRWVVSNFAALLHAFWNGLGNLIGLEISSPVAEVLSFILFYVFLTIGPIISEGRCKKTPFDISPERLDKSTEIMAGLLFIAGGVRLVYVNGFHLGLGIPESTRWRVIGRHSFDLSVARSH